VREARHTLDHWYALTADVAPGMMCADVVTALADDLNTPKAIAGLHELRAEAAKGSKPAAASLKASAGLMGLLQQPLERWHAWRPASFTVDDARIDALVAERLAARKARNFKEADRIRDELAALGVVLKDSKDGTTWEIAR
jgi:cysteinyl-tRNA synthetase